VKFLLFYFITLCYSPSVVERSGTLSEVEGSKHQGVGVIKKIRNLPIIQRLKRIQSGLKANKHTHSTTPQPKVWG